MSRSLEPCVDHLSEWTSHDAFRVCSSASNDDKRSVASTPLIYDVGMHLGEDTEFYLKKGFRVVAIEAVSDFCKQVGVRLDRSIRDGALRIINCAIAKEAGTVSFYLNEKRSIWGTADAEVAAIRSASGATVKRVDVQALPFENILHEHGVPYYLKVDIEGYDRLCLLALQKFAQRPRYVSIEAEISSWDRLVGDFELLEKLGYSQFKPVQQLTVCEQQCPYPPREGNFAEHEFPMGGSGLFGEEAPGRWLSKDAALVRFRSIFRTRHWFGDRSYLCGNSVGRFLFRRVLRMRPGWYDIHAR